MTTLVADIGTVFSRELRPTLRQPFTIIISMVQPLERAGTTVRITVNGGPALLPGILEDLRAAGAPAASIEVTRPTLDDVFLRLTGRSLREGGVAPEPVPATDALVEV